MCDKEVGSKKAQVSYFDMKKPQKIELGDETNELLSEND